MGNDKELLRLYESIQYIEDNSDDNVISEGIWSKIKYGLSKLGRYKAGGKIIGKNKVTKDAAEKVRKILNKESNKLLRGLDDKIKEVSPEFPNDEKGFTFLRGILTIGAVYDSIVAGTKKSEGEEGYIPVDMANQIIGDLRTIVTKYLDVDLAGIYTTMESEEKDGLILTEQEKEMLSEKNWLSKGYDAVKGAKDKAMDGMFGAKKGASKPREAGSRMGARMDPNSGKQDFETKRMGKDGLESNRLPAILTALGGAMGAASWMLQTEWFKDLVSETVTTPAEWGTEEIQSTIENNINVDPNGLSYTIQNNLPDSMGIDLGPNAPVGNLDKALEFYGGGNKEEGIKVISQFIDPKVRAESVANLTQQLSDSGSNSTVGDIFNTGEGTYGSRGGLFSQYGGAKSAIAKFATTRLRRFVVKQAGKTVVTTAVGGKLIAIAPMLGVLGVALVAAGVTVKVLREKGQRQSRAKTLNDLLQMLQDVQGVEGNQPVVIEPEPPTDVPPTPTDEPPIDSEFLKGNRNMQLGHLSKNFLPQGEDVWSKLGLKDGTILPTGFIDASLSQGKSRDEDYKKKYLTKYYNHLKKDGSFNQETSVDDWMSKVTEARPVTQWISSTRKNIGGFIKALRKLFKDDGFEIGDRVQAKTSRPGERGKGMGIAGANESTNHQNNLIVEAMLGGTADGAGFDESLFMKNLPQFMEMLSMMYYGAKGTKLSYNKEAVLAKCKDNGCKGGTSQKYQQTKSDAYKLKGTDYMSEEITRMKSLMK